MRSTTTEVWFTAGGKYRNSTFVNMSHDGGTPTFGTSADDEGGNVFLNVDSPNPTPQ